MPRRRRIATTRALFATLSLVAVPLVLEGSARAQPDPFRDVAPLVRSGNDAAALARIAALPAKTQRSAAARYLRGRLLLRTGDFRGAARALDALETGLPAHVAADARVRRAEALSRGGECAAAETLLREASVGTDARAAVARARLGECLVAIGRHDDAIAELRRAALEDARDVDTFAVRVALAQALHAKGDHPGARAELHALLVARPEHPDVAMVEATLRALSGSLDFTFDERLARAERLNEMRMHREAILELDRAHTPRDRESRARFLHLRGMSLFMTRHDYREAAQVLARAARLGGPTAIDDEYHAARALARSDQDDRAIAAYRLFTRRHGTHRRAGETEYFAAWLELRRGRRSGERTMIRFLEGPRARAAGGLAEAATFELGLRAFERRDHARAAARFDAYARMGAGAMVRGRGLYWRGRAELAKGDRPAAVRSFREAIGVEPLHFYALLARQRLEEMGEDPGDPFGAASAEAAAPPPLSAPALADDARFYARLGLRADAVRAIRRDEDAVKSAAPEGRGLEALVSAYHALGEASRPYRLVVGAHAAELVRRPEPATRWIWDAAYPRAFEEAVDPAARANGLAPEYLWAIMRQESGYDPEAVSYADAIGLLQMLPSTTERVAERLGITYAREQLFDPAWNARYASTYVKGLVERYDTPLAFAAFNGGGHRVTRWLEEGGPTDFDLFVERIPIDQTRNYIRRVTTHYAKYLYLRDPSAGWPLTLPARVGE